ncbi:MAG: gamma-glutamyltransferase [Alphaproteobacteria bacterium]|nr:gamma-glutamyltransferase [Alphaproteobacteria bacterium]
MSSGFSPNQSVRKPAIRTEHGVVAAQHVGAARIGAQVLAEGGNAIDAAVATSFALGVVEPWMSGIGGGGLMMVRHPDGTVHAVDFGMRTPAALNPGDYPLDDGQAEGLFAWPAVKGDRNLTGPLAIAVPGVVEGVGAAHAAWGSRSWSALVAPSVGLARRGLSVDWYATMMIGQAASGLARFSASAERFLPGGHPPPAPMTPGAENLLPAPDLAATLETIMHEGPRSLYEGPLADAIARDAALVGSSLTATDLAAYRARIVDPIRIPYRDAEIWATPELSAGPTLAHVLRDMAASFDPSSAPDAGSFIATAEALEAAYALRLAEMGDVEGGRATGCTTHFSVVDSDGMMVSLTQTLLSVFGSMVSLPETGVLMNNGVFWFDPRPGHPNSLAPAKRCLSNMCPVVLRQSDGALAAIGASGGRRIMPAVAQIVSFMTDFGMDLETALHHPRIDVSGSGILLADAAMPAGVIADLENRFSAIRMKRTVYPSWFANISAVEQRDGRRAGGVEPWLPWGDACAAPAP